MSAAFVCALLGAIFAALVTIFAKVGLNGVNSNLATTVRVIMLAPLLCGLVMFQGTSGQIWTFTQKNWLFLFLSAIATGLSWLFFFYALSQKQATFVGPIDKSSLAFTFILAVMFLHEKITWQDLASTVLVLAALGISLTKPAGS